MVLTVASLVITAIVLLLGSGIVYIVTWHLRRRRLYEMASKFEGPPLLPLIGNAHMFVGNSEHLLSKIVEVMSLYPSPSRSWLGPKLFLNVSDPELSKGICLSPKTLEKAQIMIDCVFPWLGTGLISAPASIWKVHRKIIQPTFNARILDSFVEVFAAQSKIFTDRIERNLDGPEFEIFDFVSRCTLDMICETAIGVKIEAQTKRDCHYMTATQEIIASMCKRIFSLWLYPDLIFNLSQPGRDQRRCTKYLHEFTDNVIRMKRKDIQDPHDSEDTAGDSTFKRKPFLDYLMTLPEGTASISDQAIREEVDTMVAAGSDTTALANTSVMLMLASYPEIQDKAYQELYEIYGDDDPEVRPVTAKDLPRMKYLERVIKETLRIFPVVPLIVREVTDDLEIGEHTFPRGSSIAIGIFALHRSEKYWSDPLRFDPDRFLPEEIAKRHPYAYMAFSCGPRNCIGGVYGMMSMKTLIATVLRKYVLKTDNILPVKDIRLKYEILLKPVEPIRIRITKRARN